jgi:phospholipid-transporting ATPase
LSEEYFKILGSAHEVVGEDDKKGNIKYQGPSPDEITLVEAARKMEF